MSRLALVLLALASGCYPWVGGRWDDYWVPDEAQLVGVASHSERLGGYWGDPTPSGKVWWGVLDEPRAGTSPMEIFAPDGPGCVRGSSDESVITDLLIDPGAETSKLRGPVDIEAPWKSNLVRFEAEVDDLPAGSWALEPLETTWVDTLEVTELFRLPSAVAFTGPQLSGQETAWATAADLNFAWNPDQGDADWVFLDLRLAGQQAGGYSTFEWVRCLADHADGELSISPALWSNFEQAELIYVYQGVIVETFQRVEERDFSASTVGLRQEVGILRAE